MSSNREQFEVDAIEGLVVDHMTYSNEVTAMATLWHGLAKLYKEALDEEEKLRAWRDENGMAVISMIGWPPMVKQADMMRMACRFHWFGVTLCNYARLAGFIRGLEKKHFTREDAGKDPEYKNVGKSIKEYIDSVPELGSVVIWRNKVFGHFAVTDPRLHDNVATLARSIMAPAEFSNGRFRAGAWKVIKKTASGTFESDLPEWSLTETFESLSPRYWPAESESKSPDSQNPVSVD